MKKSEWDEYLKGFSIVDCAIKNKQIAYVLVVQDAPPAKNGDVEWRLISWGPEVLTDGRSMISMSFRNFRPVPALAVEGSPYNRVMVCDTAGNSNLMHYGSDDTPAMEKMKTLWEKLYILTFAHLYTRNSEIDTWEMVDLPQSLLDDSAEKTGSRKYVLNDFDAFSPQDFYLLDDRGIILYQESGHWHETNLKDLGYRNLQTEAICCAPDGWVYVFAKDEDGGKIFQGKGDRWKVIWTSSLEIYHIDMVAYQDHVLISNNFMRLKIKDGEVSNFETPIYGKFFSVRDDLLMIASSDQAAIYDGHEWKIIISPNFNEEGVFEGNNWNLNSAEQSLLDQHMYAASEEGEAELAGAKEEIEQLDDEALAKLQTDIYSAIKDKLQPKG